MLAVWAGLRGARPLAFSLVFPTSAAYDALFGKAYDGDEDTHQGGVYSECGARNLSHQTAKSARSASAECSAPSCEPSERGGLRELSAQLRQLWLRGPSAGSQAR